MRVCQEGSGNVGFVLAFVKWRGFCSPLLLPNQMGFQRTPGATPASGFVTEEAYTATAQILRGRQRRHRARSGDNFVGNIYNRVAPLAASPHRRRSTDHSR